MKQINFSRKLILVMLLFLTISMIPQPGSAIKGGWPPEPDPTPPPLYVYFSSLPSNTEASSLTITLKSNINADLNIRFNNAAVKFCMNTKSCSVSVSLNVGWNYVDGQGFTISESDTVSKSIQRIPDIRFDTARSSTQIDDDYDVSVMTTAPGTTLSVKQNGQTICGPVVTYYLSCNAILTIDDNDILGTASWSSLSNTERISVFYDVDPDFKASIVSPSTPSSGSYFEVIKGSVDLNFQIEIRNTGGRLEDFSFLTILEFQDYFSKDSPSGGEKLLAVVNKMDVNSMSNNDIITINVEIGSSVFESKYIENLPGFGDYDVCVKNRWEPSSGYFAMNVGKINLKLMSYKLDANCTSGAQIAAVTFDNVGDTVTDFIEVQEDPDAHQIYAVMVYDENYEYYYGPGGEYSDGGWFDPMSAAINADMKNQFLGARKDENSLRRKFNYEIHVDNMVKFLFEDSNFPAPNITTSSRDYWDPHDIHEASLTFAGQQLGAGKWDNSVEDTSAYNHGFDLMFVVSGRSAPVISIDVIDLLLDILGTEYDEDLLDYYLGLKTSFSSKNSLIVMRAGIDGDPFYSSDTRSNFDNWFIRIFLHELVHCFDVGHVEVTPLGNYLMDATVQGWTWHSDTKTKLNSQGGRYQGVP